MARPYITEAQLRTVVQYLRLYHEDTKGLPSASEYLALVRAAMDSTREKSAWARSEN